MGKSIARRLISDGYLVYVAARNVDRMAELAELGAVPLKMDISKDEDIAAAVATITRRSGGVDVLVNNAGYGLCPRSPTWRELGMSERTLQRRIVEQGASRRGLVDEARQELGRQLLSDRQNGIDEIAFLLEFQETSSFYRAFRAWEGLTPAEWHRLHRGGRRGRARRLRCATAAIPCALPPRGKEPAE